MDGVEHKSSSHSIHQNDFVCQVTWQGFLAECQNFHFREFRGQSFGRVMIIINSAHGSPSDVFGKLKHDFALISFWSALPANRSRFIVAKVLRSM